MSVRWFIGLFMLFVINAIVSNILEQQDFLTAAQMAHIDGSTGVLLTEVKDPSIGGVFVSGTSTLEAWGHIIATAFTSDYSFFYDVDYTVGSEVACTALGGTWNSVITACQIPNSFMILRYIFYWPVTAAVLLFAVFTLIQVIRGS